MGMSAEDFGAVLGELTQETPWSSKLERTNPQKKATRWWFSIRNHAAAHFEAREYHDCKKRYDPSDLLLAEVVWNQLQRPELRFWILEALGLLDNPDNEYEVVVLKSLAKANTYLKNKFSWEIIERAARLKHEQLVLDLAQEKGYGKGLPHRSA